MHLCTFWGCDQVAAWRAALPDGTGRYACDWHRRSYDEAVAGRIPGLDRPLGANEDWRPSLADMVRLAGMEIRRQDQARVLPPTADIVGLLPSQRRRLTPAQIAQVFHVRRMLRAERQG